MDERIWSIMQKRLRYTDEEMQHFRNDPRNERALSRAGELARTTFTAEVIEAHGCNSRHKVGERIQLDGYGNLLKDANPERMCVFLVGQLQPLIFAAHELAYAGIDPNEMKFKTVGCLDVGLKCGGWGKVTMRLTASRV